jgi:branched-chain amino acid transport system substrate-binding protein
LLACIPLLKQNNMLSLNNAAGGKAITNPDNPLVFRFNPAIEAAYASALPYIQKQDGIKTVACINPDDETGKGNLEAAKYVLDKLKLNIITSEFFERGIKDFTPILTKIIAKNPDLIETGMSDPTSQALMLKQARELGYKGKMFLIWGPDPVQVLKVAGPLAEGAYLGATLADPINEKQKAIYARFLKKYPARDWNANYYTHNALFACLTKAIEKCQSFDSVTIAKTLEGMEWEDALGPVSFGGKKLFGIKRQMLQHVNMLKVVNGKVVWLTSATAPPGILD